MRMIEIPIKTDDWDDQEGEFEETLFYHFLNIGWVVAER